MKAVVPRGLLYNVGSVEKKKLTRQSDREASEARQEQVLGTEKSKALLVT